MKKITMSKKYTNYFDDCVQIKQKAKRFGYDLTIEQAYLFWNAYSGVRDAGWLYLPEFDTKEERKKNCEEKKIFFDEYDDAWADIFADDKIEYLDFDIIDDYNEK